MASFKKNRVIIIISILNLFVIVAFAQNPVSSFNTNQTSGCSPLTVQFTNTSINALSYYWDFGNGNTSVLINPSNVYTNAGVYNVKLIAIGANGQKDSVIANNLITVSANSTPDFHAINTTSCLDGAISFFNTSTNAVNYLWDFGDGNTSTVPNPSHAYSSDGNYTIKLVSYDTYGCPSIKIISNYIHVNPNPVTDFSVNTNTACNINQVFNFASTTSFVNAWLWDFGDGTSSSLQNPNHAYNLPGTYNVTLTSTNGSGCSNSLVQYDYILVAASQIPVFSASTTGGCFPLGVAFTDSSYSVVNWLWNFGDGNTSSDQNPSHTYQNSGNYNVSLTITTDNNCNYTTTLHNYITIANKAVSNFSLSNTTGCAPVNVHFTNLSTNAVSWLWEFGDGYTSILQNPVHAYSTNGSYNVILHAYNATGCESVYQQNNAVVLTLPTANFSSNYIQGCAPLTAGFVNTSVNSVQWLWNFGDGTSSALQSPSHTYAMPGDYTVSLIAFDSHGCSDTMIFNSYIHVINTAGNYVPPPIVTGCIPFNTMFSDATQGAVTWLWNFGDGNTSTQQNPTHTYITSGFYTVALTIHLSSGCIQFYPNFRTFDMKGGQATFTFTPQTQCAPYLVNFIGSMAGNWASGLWDFGDGQTSVLQNPIHSYSTPGFYNVKFTATTTDGCTSTVVSRNCLHFISCSSGGEGGISNGGNGDSVSNNGGTAPLPLLNSCIPFTVQFNNITMGTTSWLWNFGDGTTSTQQNPFHTYTASGTYSVKLVAHHSSGTYDTVSYQNYIHALGTTTDFNFTENNNCQNAVLTFTGISANATQWNWDFGDGNTSAIQNPTHTYTNSTNNYSITLTATNADGCSASISKNPLFTSNNPFISVNNYSVCANQQINFNCFPTGFSSYLWSFGDGTTSSLQNPVHSYTVGATFQVTLIVTDNNGCTHNSSLQNLITVSNPVANFTYNLVNGCSSKTVNFTNTSSGTTLPLSSHCKWNFGDGSQEQWGANPIHTYASSGVYQVSLTVNHDNNCFNTITKTVHVHPIVANFSYAQNTSCFPIKVTYIDSSTTSAVSWLWDFGDGTTSTLQNPVHTFTTSPYADVTLIVTDINGCYATITKPNITFFYAEFGASVTEGCAPLSVDFWDWSLNATQWLWDFGDGTTSTMQNPTHIYLSNGVFVVTLIAKSATGCSDTATFYSMNINKPIANFISTNPTNCSPALVSFTDSSPTATTWSWDFGDGSTSTLEDPGHVYNTPGFYTIKLTVTNDYGCSDSLIRVNYVEIPGSIANFTASTNQYCLGAVSLFTDFSINASTWDWNFGDGTTSSQQNPSHVYQNTGQYTVSLIVHDTNGCSSNFTFANPITINPIPTVDFTVSDTIFCTPFPVSFQNQSQNAVSYLWNFGDGTTSTVLSPIHTYINSGTYTVALAATNQFGCFNTKIMNPIIAKKTPVVDFNANVTKGCMPFTVMFNDLSANVQGGPYFWDFGNGVTSTQQNPITTFNTPGVHSISLRIINNTGCSDTVIKTAYIEVYDLNPPPISPIKSVTVISNTSTQLFWTQSSSDDFSYYEIFRKDLITGNYVSLGTINNIAITTFLDAHNLNTLQNLYCYKVQTVDICGYRFPLDSLREHCTINAIAAGLNDKIKVNWSPYVGASVTTYSVYRMEAASASPILVATVPATTLTIIDSTFVCPFYYSYRIKANNLNGNSISSDSDTCVAKPTDNVLFHQKVDVVRSTVISNSKVLTEWKAPLVALEKVTGYAIYRSTDNINFSFLITIPPTLYEYIDSDVDVNTQNYYYKIKPVNNCDFEGAESNKSSSILLKAELKDGNLQLNWTGYDGWKMGVDYYIIEKKNKNGEWEIIKKVDGNTLIYEDDN